MLNRPISKAAERVLSYLDELLAEPAHYPVELYVNGRELGYAVRCYETQRKVAFAEHRNSDGIVLRDGPAGEEMIIEDSSRVDPWIVRQVERRRAACLERLRAFAVSEG